MRSATPATEGDLHPLTVAQALERFAAPPGVRHRVQLLRPFMVETDIEGGWPAAPPLGVACLAGMLEEAGYDVDVIDALGEGLDLLRPACDGQSLIRGLDTARIIARLDPAATILGISLMVSSDWPHLRELIAIVRAARPALTIVAGGEHASALPEDLLRECPAIDYVVLGEGELAFLELVHRLYSGDFPNEVPGICYLDEEGHPVATGPGRRIGDAHLLPRPAWRRLPLSSYFSTSHPPDTPPRRILPVLV